VWFATLAPYDGDVAMFFVVERRSGPEWEPSRPLEQQTGWDAHAEFMDGLVDSGFVVLGGPLADEDRVILIVEAASEEEVRTTLARDPWSETHLVVASVEPWAIRLDGRAR
jgi:uncharacterized protein YciI